jgi:hypothetical protein
LQISADLKNGQRIKYLRKITHTRHQPYTDNTTTVSPQHDLTTTKPPHHTSIHHRSISNSNNHQTTTASKLRTMLSPNHPEPTKNENQHPLVAPSHPLCKQDTVRVAAGATLPQPLETAATKKPNHPTASTTAEIARKLKTSRSAQTIIEKQKTLTSAGAQSKPVDISHRAAAKEHNRSIYEYLVNFYGINLVSSVHNCKD